MINAVYLNQKQAFLSYLWWTDARNGGLYSKFVTFDEFMDNLIKGKYYYYGTKVTFRP